MSRADLDRQLIAVRSSIALLATFVDELLENALLSVQTGDAYAARTVQQRDDEFDQSSGAIEEKTIDLMTLQQPIVAHDLRMLVGSLVVAQRLQRVGHGAFGIARLAIEMAGFPATDAALELMQMGKDARSMLHDATVAFVQEDLKLVASVLMREQDFDERYRVLRERFLQSLSNASEQDEMGPRRLTFWLWIAHKLERVADHACVIARRVQQLQ